MSTADRVAVPTLIEGEHLDQEEFHRRYEAMPPGTRAELIEGVVFMPSPVGFDHARSHGYVVSWLTYFGDKTPGVSPADNATAIFGRRSEVQPDGMLIIEPECGGQTSGDRGYVRGGPEFVAEIAISSRYIDLGPKLAVYSEAGVKEYMVRAFHPDEVIWFRRVADSLVRAAPSDDGLYRSQILPGLWLDPFALIRRDLQALIRTLEAGMATPEHAAFVARLAAARDELRPRPPAEL